MLKGSVLFRVWNVRGIASTLRYFRLKKGIALLRIAPIIGIAGGVAGILSGCTAGFNNNTVLKDVLSVTEGASHDFGTATVGRSTEKTLTLKNSSTSIIYLLDLSPEKAVISDDFKVTGGTCTTLNSLESSAECSLVLKFNPASQGAKASTLAIGFKDDFESEVLSLAVNGKAQYPGQLKLSQNGTYDFGSKVLQTESSLTLTLTNSGESPLVFNNISTEGMSLSGPFRKGTGTATCATGGTLGVSESCVVPIDFVPSTVGVTQQVLALLYFNDVENVSTALTLSARGLSPALLSLSGAEPFSFGEVAIGNSASFVLTLTNTGGTAAQLATLSTTGLSLSAPFLLTGTDCSSGGSLSAGSSCVLTLSFSPTASATSSQTLQLAYHDGALGTSVSRTLNGRSASGASLVLVPSGTYDFGTKTAGTTTSKSFQVLNQGGSAAYLLTISNAALGVSTPFSISAGTCATNTTLGPLTGSCTLIIDYSPTAAVTTIQELTVSHTTGSARFGVQGTGQLLASLTVSDSPSYGFGSKTLTTTSTRVVTLTNTGGVAATLGNVATTANLNLAAPFTRSSGTCSNGQTLAVGGTCTLTIAYTPTAAVTSTANLSVGYNNGSSNTAVTLQLGGIGLSRASIAWSPAAYDYGSKVLTTVNSSTFTLSNSGGSTATLGTISDAGLGLASPFSRSSGTCSSSGTVAGGSSCTVIVDYTPSATVASSKAFTLSYSDAAGALSSTAIVSGTGINGAAIAASDSPTYDYGSITVDASASRTLTLTNSGTVDGVLGTISTAGLGLAAPYTLSGGTCSSSITLSASGGTCTVQVAYAPTSVGTSNMSLSVAYYNGAANTYSLRPLKGTGLSHASLTLTPASTFDFGNTTINATSTQIFTLTNQGQTGATLGTISTGGLNLAAPFSLTAGTCTTGATLAAASSCILTLAYTPTAAVTSNVSLSLGYTDVGGYPSTGAIHPLKGTGITPASLAITPSGSFHFGSQTIGLSTTQAFTITNSGASTATLGTVSTAGLNLGAPFTLNSGTCASSGTLASSASCVISLTYTPSAAINSNAVLSLSYNDGAAAQFASKDLGAMGLTVGTLTISDGPTYDYGSRTLTTVNSKVYTINNTGQTAAGLGTLNSANLNLSAPFSYNSTTCTTVIAPAGNCTITADFTPTAATTSTALLSLAYTNGVTATSSTRDIKGTGLSRAALAIAPTSTFDYGNITVGLSSTQSFTVTNSGQSAATLGTVSHAGFGLSGSVVTYTGGSCVSSGSVAASGTCTLTLAFVPTSAGLSARTITLGYSDAGGALTDVSHSVKATGLTPASLTLTPAGAFGFGSKTLTTTTTQIFTLTNSGQSTATLGTISTAGLNLAAPFTQNGGSSTCSSSGTLAAAASCTVAVDYVPSAAVTSNATLSVAYNDAVTAQSTTKALSGTGLSRASLSIAPTSTFDYGNITVGLSSTQSFTVTNSGQSAATLGTVSHAGFGLSGSVVTYTGGSCVSSGSVAAAGTCTLTLAFVPTSAGLSTRTITLGYSDAGGALTDVSHSVKATGLTPASLTLTPAGDFGFGNKTLTTTTTQIFTLTNSGQSTATLGTISTAGLNLAAPFTQNGGSSTCSSSGTLAAAASCTVAVDYAPSAAVTSNATLSVAYNDAVTSQSTTKALSGTGLSRASLTFSESPTYDAGSVTVGNSAGHAITLTNAGGSTATLGTVSNAAFTFTGTPFSIASSACTTGLSLAAGSTCVTTISFTPASSGVSTQPFTLNYSDAAGALSGLVETAKGTGLTVASIAIAPSGTYSFGSITLGVTSSRAFTLTNSGQTNATLGTISNTALNLDSSPTFSLTGATCATSGTVAASGGTCTLTLSFIPTAAVSTGATISVSYNNGVQTAYTSIVTLTGTGVGVPSLTLAPAAYNFGSIYGITNSSTRIFTFTNVGTSTATSCAAPTITGGNAKFVITSDGCGTSNLNASSTCTVSVNVQSPGFDSTLSATLSRACTGTSATTWANGLRAKGVYSTAVRKVVVDRGERNTCALLMDGTVKCWGNNANGELGLGDTLQRGHLSTSMATLVAVNLGTGVQAVDLEPGGTHFCAHLNDGNMKCWGAGTLGQLGQDNTASVGYASSTTIATMNPINIGTNRFARTISAGTYVSCVIRDDGELKCWGQGITNGLGTGDTSAQGDAAGEMASLKTVTLKEANGTKRLALQVSVDQASGGCAVMDNGYLSCWGHNTYGNVGQGDFSPRATPTQVPVIGAGAPIIKKVAFNAEQTCVVDYQGAALCWGTCYGYGLGNGCGPTDGTVRVGDASGEMATLVGPMYSNVKDVRVSGVGNLQNTGCGLQFDGKLYCWGNNSHMLGQGTASPVRGSATAVSLGTHRIRSFDIGYSSNCGIFGDGGLRCWGLNGKGELGQGDTTARGTANTSQISTMTPVNVGVTIGPIDVAMGGGHTCAVLNDGSLKCWGYNSSGELGLGDTVDRGNSPGSMDLLPAISLGSGNYALEVSAGNAHTCVTYIDGTVRCFGEGGDGRRGSNDDAQAGHYSATEVATLTAVNVGGNYFYKVQSGESHNCTITGYSQVECWGGNFYGQLGVNTSTSRGNAGYPMNNWYLTSAAGSYFRDVAVGHSHGCSIVTDGTVLCWGGGSSGQLGMDNTSDYGKTVNSTLSLTSLAIGGGRALKLVAGSAHSCVLKTDGNVRCWGDNGSGQLGQDNTTSIGDGTGTAMAAATDVNLGTNKRAVDIAAGAYHTCVILGDRTVKCWGYNGYGELGYNDTTNRGGSSGDMAALSTVNLGTGVKALKIFASPLAYRTCVITTQGQLKCWGDNTYGALGQDSTVNWGSGANGTVLGDMPAVPLR